VVEAIRNVGVANQDKRHDVSTSRGLGGIHPEEITVSRFGRPDNEMPGAGVFEGGYSRQIREVDYLRDMYGGASSARRDSKSAFSFADKQVANIFKRRSDLE
jgi:hypothetical protein